MAKMEKIRKMQIADNKENKFFYFPMVSMGCTGLGTRKSSQTTTVGIFCFCSYSMQRSPKVEAETLGLRYFDVWIFTRVIRFCRTSVRKWANASMRICNRKL